MRMTASFWVLLVLIVGSALTTFGVFQKNSLFTPIASQGETKSVKGVAADNGNVDRVIDGDTFTLTDGQKVRLIGVNAPEKGQPMADAAKTKLESLLLEKSVDLQFDVTKSDQYGRLLAYVYVENTFVNEELVKSGLSVVETIPPNVSHAQDFVAAVENARQNCRGIWDGMCRQATSSCIQISSINADTPGDDNKDKNSEWIEFLNTCANSQSLAGYLLKDNSAGNSYNFKEVMLQSKKRVKLHSGCSTDTASDLYWQCPEKQSAVWNNAGDHAYLYDSTGKLVSEMGY